MKFLWLLLLALALTACNTTEVTREIGYKGKARINPWLAAERFVNLYSGNVRSLAAWTSPDARDSVWVVPAAVLSNESYTRQMERWIMAGGHLVLLVENAESEINDWSGHTPDFDPDHALLGLLSRAGIRLEPSAGRTESVKTTRIKFQGRRFEVSAESRAAVSVGSKEPGVFVSVRKGEGCLSVLTDARIFRNRWIGDKQHAAFLAALLDAAPNEGSVAFLRGSGLSLWGLLVEHLWPILLSLAVLTLLWLWKNFTRFGPIEAVSGAAELRGFDHHLEALGDFQWRHDKAAALLVPMRAQIVEHGQHLSQRAGRRDDDFFQFLADRAGIPRERVFRALAETAPPDSAILTRTTADLQRLLQVLH